MLKIRKQFCIRGHDTFICGRNKNRSCRNCTKEDYIKNYVPHPRSKSKVQFCPKGHDTFVTGRETSGRCTICEKERYIPHPRIKLQFCSKGHDLNILGCDSDGHCSECRRLRGITYRKRNKEKEVKRAEKYRNTHAVERQLYYINNKEKIDLYNKQYSKDHPEITKAIALKNNVKRNLRIVNWTDWDNIAKFERTQLNGMTEDHIIPLLGRKVSGLHVSWNLQWLTRSQNSKKSNKCDLLEASEWYGRILEEAGLK